jgi:flagellar protein FliO/FliZ
MLMLALAAPIAAAPELLSLLGIVVMIFGAGWLSRRLQGRTTLSGRRLRCVESMAVGARDRVLLIDADGKRLLVGVGQGGMRTLHVYEGVAPSIEPPAAPPVGFAELLGRWKRTP